MGVDVPGDYRIVLNSDDALFGGFNRIDNSVVHHTFDEGFSGRRHSLQVHFAN